MYKQTTDYLAMAMALAKKTGDRLIIFDRPDSDSPVVVMPFEAYERLINGQNNLPATALTEDKLIDKINRDIALWKSQQEDLSNKKYNDWEGSDNDSGRTVLNRQVNQEAKDESKIYQWPDEVAADQAKPENEKGSGWRKAWAIPSDRKEAAEEIIEEDRQYLEPVDDRFNY